VTEPRAVVVDAGQLLFDGVQDEDIELCGAGVGMCVALEPPADVVLVVTD